MNGHLDTCAGGAGGADAASVALRTIAHRQGSTSADTGLWFLSSARRKDVADDGAFVAHFQAAVDTVTSRTGQRQRYLDLTELVDAVNEQFKREDRSQRAELSGSLATGVAPFIPNSGFRDDLPPVGTDLEIQRRVAGQDLEEHFGPRSRGVEFESEQGLYFSGRTRALTRLVAWLTASEGDGKARVVTGSPGCGKSAVLGRIVAPTISWYRARLDFSDVDPATIAPEGCATAAVHVRHKRLEEVVERIADALGTVVEGTVALLQELSRRGQANSQPIVIVIDALDEAGSGTAADAAGRGEPRRIARELLRPMSEIGGVRLLVGTRRELVSSLGPAVTVLDLDSSEYRVDEDAAGYVRKVLLATKEPGIPTPYRGNDELADVVSRGVARRADGVFLIARMTARSLRYQDVPVDISKPGWVYGLPSEIGAAFDDWFTRFGDEEARVRRILLPLAFAEGYGLPRGQIWRQLSAALSGTDCTEEDITWALTMASAYVAEVIDDGRSVYRLYHQALAEHMRRTAGQPAHRIQEAIVDALISTVPASANPGEPEWVAAAPYIRQHLATHALAAGRLADLIPDPGFLLASGQLSLLSALPSISSEAGRRIRTAYEQVAHRLTSAYPLRSRAADLQLSARRCGADLLADRIGSIGVPLPWATRWAWWSRTGAHRQLSGHTESVQCVAAANLDGRPIAVTGSWDKTARVWDLITQRQVGKPLPVGITVSSVAIGDLGDYTVALTGGVDGIVGIWDLSAGQEYGNSLTGHTNRINAIAVRNVGNRPIALTASSDGTARIWDLRSRQQIGPALKAHRRTVRTAALGDLEGRPIAVTGGNDRRLYVWDLSGLADERNDVRLDGRPLIGAADAVSAVALGHRDGRTVAVVGDDAGSLSVWDLASRQQLGEPVSAHVYYQAAGVESVAIGSIDGAQVVLTCGKKDARLWDLIGLRERGHPLRGHVDDITRAALTPGEDRPMAVTVSDDHTARVWDLTADRPAAGHVNGVLAIAFAKIGSQSLALTGGSDGTARLWDLQSRTEIGRPMEGHAGEVLATALCSLDKQAVAVTGGSDATVRLWNPMRGEPLGKPLEGHTNAVCCLQTLDTGTRSIAITGSEDGTIRLWDLSSQMQFGVPIIGHIGEIQHLAARSHDGFIKIVTVTKLNHVYLWRVAEDAEQAWMEAHLDLHSVDKTARALAVSIDHGPAIVLAAHTDNSVRAYEVRNGNLFGAPLIGHKSYVKSAAADRDGPQIWIATAGYDGIRLWDMATGQQLGEPLSGDVREKSFFAFAAIDSAKVGLAAFHRELWMCNLPSLRPIGEPLCGNDCCINAVSIAPSVGSATVITGGEDGALRMHALTDGRQLAPHITGAGPIDAMTTVRIGEILYAAVSRYTGIEVWNLTSREQVGIFHGSSSFTRPTCIAVCPIGGRIAVLTGRWYDPDIVVMDLQTRMLIDRPLLGHTASVVDLCARNVKTQPVAASASLDGTVRLWDLRTSEALGSPIESHVRGATAVALGEFDDRDVVLTGAGDGQLRMWDIPTRTPVDLNLEAHPDGIAAVRLEELAGQPFAVTADENGLVRAWNLYAERCEAEVNVGSGINDIALTSRGELCVATNMGVVALRLEPYEDTRNSMRPT